MRSLLTLALVLLSTFAAACNGDSPTNPEGRAAGTYNMTQVNGQNLPATVFQNSAGRLEITGGSMVLRQDKSYTETIQVRVIPVSGTATTDQAIENGTYSVTGTTVTFNVPAQDGDPAFSYTGTVSGDVVTYTYQGTSFTYRK